MIRYLFSLHTLRNTLSAVLFSLLGIGSAAAFEMPVGRTAWDCATQPAIYPGFWAFKNLGTIGSPATIDGTRTMAPSVVKVGNDVWLYYLAERQLSVGTSTTVLRVTAPMSDPTNFTPKNIAFQMPTSVPVTPPVGGDPEGYYAAGPFHAAVLPWLTPDGSAPGKDANGNFYPWYMYLASVGNNTAVARSVDGGVTFQLVPDKNPLFPFEVFQFKNADGSLTWRRTPVLSKSEAYDYTGSGSSAAVRSSDGVFHLFTTTSAKKNYTIAELGVTSADVGHVDGTLADIGIGYATSTDGITFTRKTADQLGVTSSAARGSGRIIDPRRKSAPNGLFEYIASRPMVFKDGALWRMMLSSHSTSYRARSLHSSDLINWTWDASPAEGLFGLGASGSFDEHAAAYPACFRDGDTYHCYYTGNGYGHVNHSPTGIGHCAATALD